MFSGIIRHLGTVRHATGIAGGSRLTVACAALAPSVTPGASVAVNGVCLTATPSRDDTLVFDVVAETLRRSTLGRLRPGQKVNLETSLRYGDPVDGHFVQGHVEGTATLVERLAHGAEYRATFATPGPLHPHIVPKGSIALDGVSLTLADVTEHTFSVALIPTTLRLTTLGDLREGDPVNVETDVLVRTVVHALRQLPHGTWRGDPVSVEMLQAHGFAP